MEILISRSTPHDYTHIKEILSKRWGAYFTLGLLLILLGIINISFAVLTTFISVIFFGCLLVAAGIAIFFHATRF